MRCKNCGAPLSGNVCEYCGSVCEHEESNKGNFDGKASKTYTYTSVVQKKSCPYCKTLIDSNAKTCEHCGKKLPNGSSTLLGCVIMLIPVVIILYLISTFIGIMASNNDEENTENTNQEIIVEYNDKVYSVDSSQEIESQPEEYVGIEKTADIGIAKITATEVKTTNQGVTSIFNPQSGNEFVMIKFLIENTSDEDIYCSTGDIDVYVDDVKQSYSTEALMAFSSRAEDMGGNVAPGKKLEIIYALELNENWTSVELIVTPGYDGDSAKFIINNQ